MVQARNDEIDISLIFKTLWNGKLKIISFIFIFISISFIYTLYTPNNFIATTLLQKSKQNFYFKYKYLNDILTQENVLDSAYFRNVDTSEYFRNSNSKEDPIKTLGYFRIDNSHIFDMFVNEFNDYEEMITILSKNNYIKDKIKNLSTVDKRKTLISFAKKFTIIKPTNKKDDWKLSFTWHDINEGTSLFDSALRLTLINVQKSLLIEIDNLAKSIDLENQLETNSLNIKLQSIRIVNKLSNARKISILMEQSKIAKELGINDNQLSKINILQLDMNKELVNQKYTNNNFGNTYFLRGYKAIDKEIELLKSRSDLNKDLMTSGYIETKQRLTEIQNDNRSKALRDAKVIIENENINKWLNFNLELAETKNFKKSSLYILISIIIGALLGSLYVVITDNLRQRR